MKIENKESYYWGPEEEKAHEFQESEEALKKACSLLPDNLWKDIKSKKA